MSTRPPEPPEPDAFARTLRSELVDALAAAGSPHRAVEQRLYMKSTMEYHGVPMATVKQISKELATKHTPTSVAQWQAACLHVWRSAEKREERYFCETWTGLREAEPWQTRSTISMYEEMIVTGAWWDLVDWLAVHRMGHLLLRHRGAVAPILKTWSTGDLHTPGNLWKRRTAILSQNRHKQATDFGFLVDVIEPSIASNEFFLRKAIGWALREHAKTNAAAVVAFVVDHKDRLSGLSKREALKHAPPEVRASVL